MRVLKWMVVGVLALIAGLIVAGLFLPDTAHVERSIVLKARPATVYTVLNGFGQFNKWSPWAGLDPATRYSHEGPLLGVGAKHSWRSEDPNVGAGSQEILEAVPYERIRVRLVFEGFDSENVATYQLRPEGEGTHLTWAYDTQFKGNLLSRYFGLMMDGMLGADYERGLASLKTLVEALPPVDPDLPVQLVETKARPLAYVAGEGPAEQSGPLLAAAHARVAAWFESQGLRAAEAPIAVTRRFDEATRYWQFDAALVPDRADPPAPPAEGPVKLGTSYAGPALQVVHQGPYASMEPTYAALIAFRTAAGLADNGHSWEQYRRVGGDIPEAEWLTDIFWPVK